MHATQKPECGDHGAGVCSPRGLSIWLQTSATPVVYFYIRISDEYKKERERRRRRRRKEDVSRRRDIVREVEERRKKRVGRDLKVVRGLGNTGASLLLACM